MYGKGTTSSPNFTIIASVAPGIMNPLVTDMVVGTNLVKFTWSPPSIGAGSIDSYNVLFYDKGSNSYSNQTLCQGSNSTIVSQNYCTVPMYQIV